jgi:hypothetical protein
MLTTKDFVALAQVIHTEYETTEPHSRHAVASVAYGIAAVCKESNPRFDYDRFIAACGVAAGQGVKSFQAIVAGMERLENTPTGNPRWKVITLAGGHYRTHPNGGSVASFGQYMVGRRYEFFLDPQGRIEHAKEVNAGE